MNKMTKSMLTLALMGLTLSAGAAHAEETLRVAADLSYPPFQFRNATMW
jgi:lysine/arginine/ornithine transport system substrate-binding protein